MNKPQQQILSIKGLKQQLEDTRLRLAQLEAQGQEGEAPPAALDAPPSDTPEKREEARFFARAEKGTLRIPRPLTVAAAAVLILCLSLGTALAVSPALRVQIMRLLYAVTPEYTEIRFAPDEAASFDVPAEWTGLYYPAYIPEGYSLYGVGGSVEMPIVAFVGEGDRLLRFSEYSLNAESNVNSEGYTVNTIDINGSKGLMSWKAGHTILVWSAADRYFILSITENTDIALTIARSVIRVK